MRFKTPRGLKSGWTTWQQPVMKGYLMKCCDCGLVHEMEFGVLRYIKKMSRGFWEAEQMDTDKYRVEFRIKRYDATVGES